MPSFSNRSLQRLGTCEDDLQKVAKEAIKNCPIDFGIAEGHRSLERQKELFDEGKSLIDGVSKKGKHNYDPSRAFDIYAWVDGKASWKPEHLSFIAGWILKTAEDMDIEIQWGGFWNSFVDMPHFQI